MNEKEQKIKALSIINNDIQDELIKTEKEDIESLKDNSFLTANILIKSLNYYNKATKIKGPLSDLKGLEIVLGEIRQNKSKEHVILLNINSLKHKFIPKQNNHYTAIVIKKEKEIEALYIDPMGFAIDKSIKEKIKEGLGGSVKIASYHGNIQCVSLEGNYLEYKGNTYDCGPFLILLVTSFLHFNKLCVMPNNLNTEVAIELSKQLGQEIRKILLQITTNQNIEIDKVVQHIESFIDRFIQIKEEIKVKLAKALNHFREDIEGARELLYEDGTVDYIIDLIQTINYEKEIDLRDYHSEIASDSPGYELLAEALPYIDKRKLYLPNDVNIECLEPIIKGIACNHKMEAIGFGNVNIGNEELKNILSFIVEKTTIKSLYLHLTDGVGILDLLPWCTPILQSDNFLTSSVKDFGLKFVNSAGALSKLFAILSNNAHIETLELDIDRQSKRMSFGDGLAIRKGSKTEFIPNDFFNIKDSLLKNATLKLINFNGKDIDDNFAQTLIEVIKERELILDIEFGEGTQVTTEVKKEVNIAIINKIISTLFQASWLELGDIYIRQMLETLERKNFNFNTRIEEEGGYGLIHQAIYNNNLQIFKLLITKYNADPTLLTEDKKNIIHIAVETKNFTILKELFFFEYPLVQLPTFENNFTTATEYKNYRALFNQFDEFKNKPIHLAVNTQNEELVSFLIDCIVDINDLYNVDFIKALIRNSMIEPLSKVLAYGFEVSEELEEIEEEKKKEEVQEVLSKHKELQKQLFSYVSSGKIKEVKSIFENEYKINFFSKLTKELVEEAFRHKQYEICAFFMSQDVNNEIDYNALTEKYEENEKKIISILQHQYLESSNQSLVDNITSKLKFKGNETVVNDLREKVKIYLLNHICTNKLLKPILQVIKYDSDLNVTIDLSKNDISNIYLSKAGEGITISHRSEVYIGLNSDFNEFIATIIHEFCHHACYLLWKNDSRPHGQGDNIASKLFDNIDEELKERSFIGEFKDEIIEAIKEVFTTYNRNLWRNEFIARVPQIIITHGDKEKYFTKFDEKHPLKQLFVYYEDTLLKAINEFIEEIESKKLNEKLSELKKSQISLINPNIQDSKVLTEKYGEEVNKAATTIQALFRGFKIRTAYKEILPIIKEEEKQVPTITKNLELIGYADSIEAVKKESKLKKEKWIEKIENGVCSSKNLYN